MVSSEGVGNELSLLPDPYTLYPNTPKKVIKERIIDIIRKRDIKWTHLKEKEAVNFSYTFSLLFIATRIPHMLNIILE